MNNSELARRLGKTPQAISKWSPAKRDEAIRNLQAGVNPIIAELVGELQRECYVAMCHTGITLEVYFNGKDVFCVVMTETCGCGIESAYIADNAPLNPYELQGAIVKVKELYHG